jgi:serine/threonine-protein kinase OSR1/STK39
LKADNILVNENGQLVIGNFALTTSLKTKTKIIDFVGSPCWMAPEKIEQKDGYDFKSDVWSLGIIAIEIVSGQVPYEDLPPMKSLMNIFNMDAPRLNKYEAWSTDFRTFVADCLTKDPKKRISINEIL